MVEERSLTWHYVLRAAILGGFCYYIVHLTKTEHLVYYIAPRMQLYVKLAALALFAVALHQVYMAYRSIFDKGEPCECGHEPPRTFWGSVIVYGLFLVPLALGMLLPDQMMGSSVVSIKGMNLSAAGPSKQTASAPASAPEMLLPIMPAPALPADRTSSIVTDEDAALKEMFKNEWLSDSYSRLGIKLYKQDIVSFEDKGFMETMTALDLYLDNFIGKQVEISGFVYRENEMMPNQFVVSRLAMQCCSADASPYGILVESTLSHSYAADTWVKVTGTLGKTNYNGYEFMKLDAKRLEKIQPPKIPYVYPDYDFLD